jgi:1-acyl-sn-glycerol-3-phosphate acyltransferase
MATLQRAPQPRPTLRRRVKWGIFFVVRFFVRRFAQVFLGLRIRGQENIPATGPVLLAANHIHNFDPIAMNTSSTRPLFFMAKKELFQQRQFGALIRSMGAFPVDRERVDRAALRQAGLLLDEGLVVAILPEGTRSTTHALQPGNPGAALIVQGREVPIVPVAITGTQYLPVDSKRAKGRWLFGRITVTFGKPFYLPQRRPGEKLDLYAATERIMLEIAALLPPEYRGIYAEQLDSSDVTTRK